MLLIVSVHVSIDMISESTFLVCNSESFVV